MPTRLRRFVPRIALSVAFTLGLTACATTAPLVWVKPGATLEDFRRDKYTCVQEARTSWQGQGLIMIAVMQAQAQAAANRLFDLCMQAHGYDEHAKAGGEAARQ